MNVLKEIEEQISAIRRNDESSYLDSIFIHIDRAEFYYKHGKNDTNYFNDVIYRSNQAYEGALKESYKVLANKTSEEVARKSTNEIENFFETNNVFKERVLQLFKNYRQEWRNKSTHDYKLFFDESEAFIALTSVTSFVHLLLKQIQEKTSYKAQQKKLETESDAAIKSGYADATRGATPLDKLLFILDKFAEEYKADLGSTDLKVTEQEIAGLLLANMEYYGENVTIKREPVIDFQGRRFMPDFLIEFDNGSVILELKNKKQPSQSDLQVFANQVFQYMEASTTLFGVVYYTGLLFQKSAPKVDRMSRVINDINYEIVNLTA